MKRVFICSRYAGNIEENVSIAQRLCRKAIEAGAAPFAPHLIYPTFVDDNHPGERETGISCGLAFLERCDEVWAHVGNGISEGMRRELAHALVLGKPVVEFREV